jgi:peptide/nickel transport system substrate-binding protein
MVRVDLDYSYNPGSGLATKWTHSADLTTWEYNIVDNATWHDGEPVTINDVYFTFMLYNDSSLPRYSWLTDYLIDLTIVNNTAIRFTYSYGPKPADVLAEHGITWILPEHIWEEYEDDPASFTNLNPIGCGIWKFEEWAHGDFFRFSRNDDYFKEGQPYVEEKIVKIIYEIESAFYELQTGDLHVVANPPPELEALAKLDPDIKVWEGIDDYVLYLGMNQRRYPNNVLEFRQAVSHGINRTEIIDAAFNGRGVEAPASMSMPFGPYYEPNVREYPFDVAKANAMLDALGWVDTDDDGIRETDNGTVLSFDYSWVSTIETSTNAAFLMQSYMLDLGIELNLDPVIWDVLWHRVGGDGYGVYDYDWCFVGWVEFWSDHHPSWMGWMFNENQWWGSDDVNIPGWTGANRTAVTDLTSQISLEPN